MLIDTQLPHAADLMSCPAITVTVGGQLNQAAHTLLHSGHSTVAVVDNDGHLINLLTEDSLTKAYLAYLWDETVSTNGNRMFVDPTSATMYFALPPQSISLHTPLPYIIEAMLLSGLRTLPVVHNRRPVGSVGWPDILTCTPRE